MRSISYGVRFFTDGCDRFSFSFFFILINENQCELIIFISDSTSNKSPPSYAMFVPHALALDEDKNLIYVADREDGRVMCYNAQNGSFHREYKHPVIGTKVYSIAYARDKIYLVNGLEVWTSRKFHIRGFVIDAKSGEVVSQFAPGNSDMLAPHDIAVSDDGSEIYVVELNAGKAYRFLQG